MRWPKSWLETPGWYPAGLLALAALLAAWQIVGFWPGSVGHDFHITIDEARAWRFSGHQPPTAAFAVWLLSLGTGNYTISFVFKVVIYFTALAVIGASRGVPFLVRLGALALTLSPILFSMAPLLRNSAFEVTFLFLAMAAALAGRTRAHVIVAIAALIMATLFAPLLHPGHAALVALYFLWRQPNLGLVQLLKRTALASAILALPAIAVNQMTGNVDRGSTIYVSALNSIGGMYKRGDPSCLPPGIVRGDKSAEDVLADHYTFGNIVSTIWADPVAGFKLPTAVTREDRKAVLRCWATMIQADPFKFVLERLRMAAHTIGGSRYEPHYVWLPSESGWVLNPQIKSAEMDMPPLAKPIERYGRVGERAKMGSAIPYLGLFLLAGLVTAAARPSAQTFVAVAALAVLGFMSPQLAFAQEATFRYYVPAATVGCWSVLAFLWLLVSEPVDVSGRLQRLRQLAAAPLGLVRSRAPPS